MKKLIAAVLLVFSPLATADLTEKEIELRQSLGDSIVAIYTREPKYGTKVVSGSGFSVSDNLIATNFHVIEAYFMHSHVYPMYSEEVREKHNVYLEPYFFSIIDNNKNKVEANLINIDIANDLAIFEVTGGENLPSVPVSKRPSKKGESLYSLGHGLDLGLLVSRGLNNGYSKKTPYTISDPLIFYGDISSGMSGGAVVNLEGELVGINHAQYKGNDISLFIDRGHLVNLIKRGRSKDLGEEYLAQLANISNFEANSVESFRISKENGDFEFKLYEDACRNYKTNKQGVWGKKIDDRVICNWANYSRPELETKEKDNSFTMLAFGTSNYEKFGLSITSKNCVAQNFHSENRGTSKFVTCLEKDLKPNFYSLMIQAHNNCNIVFGCGHWTSPSKYFVYSSDNVHESDIDRIIMKFMEAL